jgi:hypothetical protein
MKLMIIFISLTVFAVCYAKEERVYLGDYLCLATKFVQAGDAGSKNTAQGRLEFNEYSVDGVRELRGVVGHVLVANDYSDAYYGIFYFEKIVENLKFRPTKYKNHTQYKQFDAYKTNGNDGGGMWGEFVVNKDKTANFDANFQFKAGDHMGGVVVFDCKKQE